MQLYLHNTLFNHTTSETDYYFCLRADFCMGVQHSYPNLLLIQLSVDDALVTLSTHVVEMLASDDKLISTISPIDV